MTRRNLGTIHVGALLVSASYGVAFLLGSGEMALHCGMAGSLYAISTALGMLILAVAAPNIWRGRELIWEVFGKQYGPVVRKLVVVLSLLWMSGVLAAQIHGGIAVLVAAGCPVKIAQTVIAIALLMMSSVGLEIAASLFAVCLLGSNLALWHALVGLYGLPLYLHAWPSFIGALHVASAAESITTVVAIGFLVITGSDYQQFVIAARRPADAWRGCLLAGIFLMVTGFLPAATVVAALQAGQLSGLTDTASVIPWIMLRTGGTMGSLCIGVILLSALGSGAAVTRAMVCAWQGLRPVTRRSRFKWEIVIILIGCAVATDGQAIISTIVSLNIVYVSAVGLLFVLHETEQCVPPRCATLMMLSGAASSMAIEAIHWTGIATVPGWLPLPAGLVASGCALFAWQFVQFRRRVRS